MVNNMSFSRKISCPYCGAVDRIPADQFNEHLKCGQCQREIFASKPVDLTTADFQDQVGNSESPVLVDFWASWCGPCKAMAPAFEQAARSLESKVKFAKLNTDEEQEIAQQYGIRSIPTMILFRDGQEVARHSGAMMASDIEQWLDTHLEAVSAS